MNKSIIEDLIISAIEGGSNYWYRIESETKGDWLKVFNERSLIVSNQGIEYEDDKISVILNDKILSSAVDIMKEQYPKHYDNATNENGDAETGDVFLQCCIFGEVIYG